MGGQQSTRRVTVVSDDAAGVIKVSDAVVKRLKEEMIGREKDVESRRDDDRKSNGEEASKDGQRKPCHEEGHSAPKPHVSPVEECQQQQHQQHQQQQQQQHQQQQRLQRPIIQYMEEPSMTSLKVRAEKEQELAEADRYWKQRLHVLENEQSVLSNQQLASVKESVKEMESLQSYRPTLPVCPEFRASLDKCLKENKGRPLVCSQEVKKFASCVDAARLTFSGKAG